jgi:acetyl-CoA C-acetyltransferase
MGCSRFGERWDVGSDQLVLEAFRECLIDAGIERHQIGAAWLGVHLILLQ